LKPAPNLKLQRKISIYALLGCVIAGLLGSPGPTHAREGGIETEETEAEEMDTNFLARLFIQAEEATGIPRRLLAAIAAQESSFHPWSINLDGRNHYPATKKEALDRIGNCQNFDLGLMQINSMWLPRFGVSAEDALDPTMNVLLGSTILLDCIGRYGLWDGIACYHAGNPRRQRGVAYAAKVVAKWQSLKNVNPGDDETERE